MKTENITETKPPYVAYKTFVNFVASLRESGLPSRIDRSVFTGMSGANQSFLLAALKFLGLIDDNGTPTPSLKDLIDNKPNEKAMISKVVKEKYNFIFNSGFNINAATTAQLTEKFKERGIGGSTIVKAISFFTSLCEAADIKISPHLKTKRGAAVGSGSVPRKYKKRKATETSIANPPPLPPVESFKKTMEEMLLGKFPDFDPKWDADTQKKWFENFEKFMELAKKAEPKQ